MAILNWKQPKTVKADNSDGIASQEAYSYAGAVSGAYAPRYDPTGGIARKSLSVPSRGIILDGYVLQSRVAAYDYLCQVGNYQVACTMLSRGQNMSFGVSSCDLLPEGSRVLVYQGRRGDPVGWILGVINLASYLAANSQGVEVKQPMAYEFEDVNPYEDNPAYQMIEDDNDSFRLWASDNRPEDVLPGETAIKNENNCGYDITSYAVQITGGNSFIRVGRIDDEIRMRSTNFTKWTAAQAFKEFNDGGYISTEGRDYSYQGELLGDEGLIGKPFTKPSETKGKSPRSRTRWWKGFLGNMFSWFLVRPKQEQPKKGPGGKSGDDDDGKVYVGLAGVHVGQAGSISVKAAGGISLERSDTIPVPKRLKPEWDPQGDKEKDVKHEAFKPFKLPEDNPHAIGLLSSSKLAWEQKQAYQRFDELKKDFHVPEEDEVPDIKNNDEDPSKSRQREFTLNKGYKSGLHIGDDGSIIIRDAWGSEIVMFGGNIYINTPGNILTTAHLNIVAMAGNGMALSSNRSTDITADEGHLRLHACKLVEIAGGTDKTDGGVLIESLAKESRMNAKQEAGDEARISGVVIKSKDAGVTVCGHDTYITGKKNIYISCGQDGWDNASDNKSLQEGDDDPENEEKDEEDEEKNKDEAEDKDKENTKKRMKEKNKDYKDPPPYDEEDEEDDKTKEARGKDKDDHDDGEGESLRSGTIYICGKSVYTTGSKAVASICRTSVCYLSSHSVLLAGNARRDVDPDAETASVVVSGNSTTLLSGHLTVPSWVPVSNTYKGMSTVTYKKVWKVLQSYDLTKDHNWKDLVTKAVFSFRNDEQARTDKGIEPWEQHSDFQLFEPYWQVMYNFELDTVFPKGGGGDDDPMLPKAPKARIVHRTKRWPSRQAYDNGKFVWVEVGDLNIDIADDDTTLLSKTRKELKDEVKLQETELKDEDEGFTL